MSDETNAMLDPLADLGLTGAQTDADVVNAAGAAASTEASADAPRTRAPRVEVEIGELEFGEIDFIPAAVRGGEKGSKYEFEKLAAPTPKDPADLSKGYSYKTFTVNKLPDVQAAALKRSVQSAVTAENRTNKKNGNPAQYVSRSVIKAGEFVGLIVIRVDATIDVTAE